MFSFVLLVVSSNILLACADNNEHKIQFDEAALTKLRLSPSVQSTAVSYDEFELFNEHHCAIECLKEKNICTGYTYTASNRICALFDDSTVTIDSELIELVTEFHCDLFVVPLISSRLATSVERQRVWQGQMSTGCHLFW